VTDWVATTTVPSTWRELGDESSSIFHSEDWMALLERSFGCSSLYFLRDDHQKGAAISLFRAGPFRIGYLGFPVGGTIGSGAPAGEFFEYLQTANVDHMPVAIRIPVSGFGESVELDLPYETTAETAIVDLQSWGLDRVTKNRRRDVNRSLRSGLDLVDASDPADAARIYELYRATLERNDGSLRYNATYFGELIQLAQRRSGLRVLVAKKDGAIVAFTVVVLQGSMSYYLHGAFDWAMREYLPSAMLLNEAIEWVKSQGSESFNLMSSPQGQDSLIKYKERWGAETREHRTYTMPVKSTYAVFKLAERLYRMIR
jgi:hypothetical protein